MDQKEQELEQNIALLKAALADPQVYGVISVDEIMSIEGDLHQFEEELSQLRLKKEMDNVLPR